MRANWGALGTMLAVVGCGAATASAKTTESTQARLRGARTVTSIVGEQVPRVTAVIDYSKPDSVAEQIDGLAKSISGELIYLDLMIVPQREDASVDYNIAEVRGAGEAQPLRCFMGERLDSRSLRFDFHPHDEHFGLEIVHAPPDVAPYSTAACVYRDTPDVPVFVIRGYYAISEVLWPEYVDIQLRPVTPGR